MIDTLNDNLQTIYNELMTKLIPENLRSGVNLLNVTGTLEEGGVKLFNTIEEMRADTTAKEGDLAIVYRNQNIFDGIYIYKNNNWELAPTQLTATSDYVYKQSFYGKNGIENGTLGTPDNSFADTNAELYNKIQNQYENMEPRILTDDDKPINKSIYFIPVKKDGTPLLDTSNVTDMSGMFSSCTNLTTIPLLDTSNVTKIDDMFNHCPSLTTIPLLDFSKVETAVRAFVDCTNLTEIPLFNTEKLKDTSNMFSRCTSLTTIPLLDTSNVTKMYSMFNGCTSLTTIPQLDTSNVTNMRYMFNDCTSLATIPQLNTSNVTNMSNMFSDCTSLTTIPLLDTSNVTRMSSMFSDCTNLTTIPELNTSSATNISYMFNGCTSLSDESLNNILVMCKNAVKITSNKTLEYIGLTEEQANICKTLSNYQDFVNAGWTTGY